MIKKESFFTSKSAITIVFIAIFSFVGYFNYLYPLWQDDGVYLYIWDGDQPIRNICDILLFQYKHYIHWGGRVVVHAIAQLLLLVGKPIASFLNTVAFVLLIYMMYKIANIGRKSNWVLLLLIFLATWLFQGHLPNTIFWVTGSANYLWGTLIILLFIYKYVKYFLIYYKKEKINNEKRSINILVAILFFFFGILAGWTNENMAVALVPCLILIIAYLKYTYSVKLPLWMYAGLLGATIGALLLILAPGNFVRLGLRSDILPISIRIEEAWSRANKILLFSTIVLIAYAWVKKACTKQVLILSSILAIYALLALGAMIVSPEFPPRAWFGIVTLMIIVCGMLLANLKVKEHLWYKRAILFISFVAVVFFAVDYIQRIPYMRSINRFWKEREQIVKEAKEQGAMDIVFSQTYNISYERYDTADMTTDIEDWRNTMYKKYWGLNSVRISEDAEIVDMKRYYKKK